MTEDIAHVIQEVQRELGDLIDLLDREGAKYARDVAESLFEGRRNHPVSRTLPKPIAALIREQVMDAAEHRPVRFR